MGMDEDHCSLLRHELNCNPGVIVTDRLKTDTEGLDSSSSQPRTLL